MQSDTEAKPMRYLRNVLLDGARPFLYRSGVSGLLGFGGNEAKMAFSRTGPVVGFPYAHAPFQEPSQSRAQASGNAHDIELPPACRSPLQSSVGFPASVVQPLEGAEDGVRGTEPGAASSRSPSLQTLPASPGNVPGNRAIKRKTAEASPLARSNALDQSEYSKPVTEESEGYAGSAALTPQAVEGTEKLHPASLAAAGFSMRLSSTPSGGRSGVFGRTESVPIESISMTGRKGAGGRDSASSRFSPELSTVRRDLRSDEHIEQLRYAVHDFMTKRSSAHGQTSQDAPPELPPSRAPAQPVQPVIILRQPVTETRAPLAFWERSYLARIRTRIVR